MNWIDWILFISTQSMGINKKEKKIDKLCHQDTKSFIFLP